MKKSKQLFYTNSNPIVLKNLIGGKYTILEENF
jgi:hypothetical protein